MNNDKSLNRLSIINNHLQQAREYLTLNPSNTQSSTSGGTADILPNERKKASFDSNALSNFLYGGEEAVKRRNFIYGFMTKDLNEKYNFTRGEHLKYHVRDFVGIHKKFSGFKVNRDDIATMSEITIATGSLSNSHSIFMLTVIGQGNEEQQRYWVPKILKFEITGSYAQTELGHGSNVRGLQTQAVYDRSTDEFVINTPTLQSIKWWPGCLGKVATHVVLYAQLIIDSKEYGVNVFIMQIRDENHQPLKGIKLGDLGNKVGDAANDTGYMIVENVRIPRENLLSKFHTVNAEGKYVVALKADPQVHYTTMMSTRAMMVNTAGARLCQASTIAIRYSCVRQQGFKDTKSKVSYKTEEFQIIDYKIQQYRLFKQLALGYALKLNGKWMLDQLRLIEGTEFGQIKTTEGLKEIANTSAGLKSMCTMLVTTGVEDLRKCCGGNGYLLNSGIASLSLDYLWQVTAEGDVIILALMTSKYLMKCVGKVLSGEKLKGIMEYLNDLKGFNSKTSKPKSVTSVEELKNNNHLLELFKFRSLFLNLQVAGDITKAMKAKKLDQTTAFNMFSNDLLKATYAHCYYIISVNFLKKIEECFDPKLNKVLTKLFHLYTWTNFLDDNWGQIFESNQHLVIRDAVYEVMDELRPDAIALTDAFAYPDNLLKSTIGSYDGNVYENLFNAAQHSVLNQQEVFDGYTEFLKPHLNHEMLKHGNKPIPKNSK